MNRYQSFCRRAAADGMVLLKNEKKALPIAPDKKIALFGRGQFVTFKSGCGSGDVVGVRTVSAVEGLHNAGVPLCEELYSHNRAWHLNHFEEVKNADKFYDGMKNMDEIPLTERMVSEAAKQTDTAVVILSRVVGEGRDIPLEKGEFYLADKETDMLRMARKHFAKVIVCLNFGGVYDLSGVVANHPDAILYMSQGGQQVGNALADILLGKVTPSGKLTDTWAKRYTDYPTTEFFGEMEVPYKEGIYVGYRYFDSFGKEPLYPFGFGLSYTDFEIRNQEITLSDSVLALRVAVKNTGAYPGREVVQCYLSKPQGKLKQAYQDLVAFAKTGLLAPGEEETLELSFDFRKNASYCTETATYLLPKGEYFVRVGNGSRSTHIAARVTVQKNMPVLKTVNRFAPNVIFREITARTTVPYTYPGEGREKETAQAFVLPELPCEVIEPAENHPPKLLAAGNGATVTIQDVAAGRATAEELVAQLNLEELGCIANGVNYGLDTYEGGIIGSMSDSVPGAAGETFTIPKYGITGNVCADGPAGIRLLSSGDDFTKISEDDQRRTLTAYPVGTCFANSWDEELAREYGQCIAEEMARFHIDGWLAPGMNIHRNPLCGRNFEYFSEDPFVSGKMAAAQTVGVQWKNGKSTGKYTTIKHFVANNQETLRTEMSSEVSERTLREIYLKPFEIAVRESQPHALMTSYNRLNGVYATVNYDLLNGVLRSEWGFEGIVMSDWGATGDFSLRPWAGNDLNMPGSGKTYINLMKGGKLDIPVVQECAVRIIKWLVKTSQLPTDHSNQESF